MNLFTDRTYALLVNALKFQNLPLDKACERFGKLPLEVRRDVQKTGVIKFILEHKDEWNK